MKAVIQIISKDKPGVLNRVTALLRRKRFNIIGITAGPILKPKMARFAITIDDTEKRIKTIMSQIAKLIEVISVKNMMWEKAIMREIMLVEFKKISSLPKEIEKFETKIIGETDQGTILEVVGSPEEINDFIEKFKGHGMLKIARSGITSLKLN